MLVFDSILSGFPVIRFVRKFFNYTGKVRYVEMALPLFKGLILPCYFFTGCFFRSGGTALDALSEDFARWKANCI